MENPCQDSIDIQKDHIHVTVNVWGTGTPLREFMYSQDMAEACVYVMENTNVSDIIEMNHTSEETDAHPPHFINLGTGEEISIRDLAVKIKKLTGFKGEILFDASKPDGTMRKITDVTRLRQLGYKHRTDLDTGLKKALTAYLEQ